MNTVRFMPNGTEVQCHDGETVFDAAQRGKVSIDTACVGKGTCGLCRIRIIEGEDNLGPVGTVDENHLGNVYFLTKVRLACQARVHGDVTVEAAPKKVRNTKRR